MAESDRFELFALMCAYGACVDARDPVRFAALFLPSGAIESRLSDGTELVRRGTEQLMNDLPAFQDPSPFLRSLHVVGNHLVQIDGDTASGWMHCVAHHLVERNDGYFDEVMYLRYDDTFVRTDAGWRFEIRRISQLWKELSPVTSVSGLPVKPGVS